MCCFSKVLDLTIIHSFYLMSTDIPSPIFTSFVIFLREGKQICCLSTKLSRQTARQLSAGTSQFHYECAGFYNSWHSLQKKHSLSDHLLGHHCWAHGWHHVHSNKSQSTLWPNVQPTLLSDWVFPVPSCSPRKKSRHCAGREKNPQCPAPVQELRVHYSYPSLQIRAATVIPEQKELLR